ncbi:MAG: O-antigen ligase family protein [Anaerolineae bacterium]|nr:O-antigen ligase family protein [Thermoflexales bacterium]MDW8406526.1 O-antigen ligase family protein [Anaerolineae bacterium]
MQAQPVSRYRLLSAVGLMVALLAAGALYAVHSAQATELRGAPAGFPLPARGAESLRLGVNAALEQYDDLTLDKRLADLRARGIESVRQVFRWSDLEPQRGMFDWRASDRILAALQRHNMRVLVVFYTTPAWARLPSGSDQFLPGETQPPADPNDFARFAGAFAARYEEQPSDRSPILAYQIWDEPNLLSAWGDNLANPELYLKMLRGARRAIHAVNPNALIALAALAPTVERGFVNPAAQLYLRRLYELGGRDAFDIVAAKPYGFDFPPEDRRVDAGLLNFSHVVLLREEMIAHGDADKAIWFTQFGWNALPAGWQGEPSIWGNTTEAEQADYTRRAVRRVAQEWPWVGAMFIETLQPLAHPEDARWGFALIDRHGQARPVYTAFVDALQEAQLAPRPQWFVTPITVAGGVCYVPNPLAVFSEGWRFGELGADIPQRPDARVVFRFNGDALALIVRRDNYRAYTFVQIDGRPANLLPVEERGAYLIMTSPDLRPAIDVIPVAEGLGPGPHTAELTIDRGWNQWALIGWSSTSADRAGPFVLAQSVAVLIGLAALGMIAWSAPRADWPTWIRAVMRRLAAQGRPLTWQAIVSGLIVWVTSSLTWAQDAAQAWRTLGAPAHVVISGLVSAVAFWSPVFVISLVALAVLFVFVLVRLDTGLMLLAFFIPFYILPQRLFERAFSMAELLTLMCLVSWAVRVIPKQIDRWRVARPRLNLRALGALDWGVVAVVTVALVSSLQAEFRVEAFREWRVVILEPALVYAILRTTRFEREVIWRVLDGFVLGALAIAGIGLFNYAQGNTFSAEFGFPRIRSIFGSPNNDALYLERAFAVLIAVALIAPRAGTNFNDGRSLRRVLYGLAVVPITLAIVLSASRGALALGVPAAVLTVLLVAGGRWRRIGFALAGIFLIGLLVLVSGAAQPLVAGTRFEHVLDLTRGTGFFRVNLWQSALRMISDHIVFGVGPDNFLYAYRGFYILPAAWQEPNLSHPHNIALDFAARLGLAGLAAGLIMIGAAIASALRLVRAARLSAPDLEPVAIGLLGLLAAMLAHGLVDHAFFLVDLAFVFMLATGVTAQAERQLTAP